MSAYSAFFFGSAPNIVQLQLIEFSHPFFSGTYRRVRNNTAGVTVTHEGGAGPFFYSYLPLIIKPIGSGNDLDQSIEITFGDVGELVPTEIASVMKYNAMGTKPLITYREYRSDDLTVPLYGPFIFRVDKIGFNQTGATIKAKAAVFNRGRIGLYYTRRIFPMLRAK